MDNGTMSPAEEVELGQNVQALALEAMEANDRAMRMEIALRLIHQYAMTGLILPDSGAVRDWLADWITGKEMNGETIHGPVGGPMIWPAGIPGVARQLLVWGFEQIEGPGGRRYVGLKRHPAPGEATQ